ncbi:ATP-dependent RNA helicase dbp6 [Marasmius crinis-equi]|uniref:ATP-dependent RNA helicase n=1 Tax=Marasmius crinis-equi TaxID=585013 RepID=A0ABR3FG13_9AGAR
MEAAPKEKSKTKAKQRYLKRKKERRKHKKHSQPKHGERTEKSEGGDDESEEDEEGNDEAMEVDEEPVAPIILEDIPAVESKSEKRPKKRRKLSVDAEEVERVAEDEEPEADEAEDEQVAQDPAAPSRSPSPTAALPSFPLPSLPDAPTESALALQGLDQALIDAEVVDPGVVQPISEASSQDDVGTKVSEKMRKRLHELGITELFAVQTALLPFLLPSNPWQKALYQPYDPPRDVCVSAPTGSGKTLAYAIPIVEILSSRIVTRLRALIVLPTRDLVAQVRETFEAISRGRGLKIGAATGQHSFAHEQSQLVGDKDSRYNSPMACTRRLLTQTHGSSRGDTQFFTATPAIFGMVIDEADRLLAQSYQDWLIQILAATRPPKSTTQHVLEDLVKASNREDAATPLYPNHDALNPAFMHLLPYPDIPSFIAEKKESSCQKLLFSATLTRDPAKLASLELKDPKYFVVHRRPERNNGLDNSVLDVVTERFTFPETLKEHMVVCETAKKPLILFHLVHQNQISNALIFTKSAESTARLVQLFDFFEKSLTTSGNTPSVVIRAYSSDLGAAERKSILQKFKDQEIQILICSDLISRGIDISHVSHIVSYDAPVDMRKYVHRVGRTARAGKEGDAWTLVEEQEARYFKSMMKNASHLEKVKRERIRDQDLEPLVPHYEVRMFLFSSGCLVLMFSEQNALGQLKEVYSRG